ncbi:MAG: DciA family protein [Actinomycetota bacterium]
MRDGDTDPVRLGALLGGFGKRVGFENPVEAGRIWRGWHEIVGSSVARHAEPTSLRRGVLRVRADSSTWATEIGYLGDEIRRRANEHVGKTVVEEVRVWTGPGTIPAPGYKIEPAPNVVHKEPPTDPKSALGRAFRAWARRASRGSGGGPKTGP